jgi:hypothetical protein
VVTEVVRHHNVPALSPHNIANTNRRGSFRVVSPLRAACAALVRGAWRATPAGL